MARTTADMVKDYLEIHFYLEEGILPYSNPDGRIMFFINKYGVHKAIVEETKEQLKEKWKEENYKELMNTLENVVKNPIIENAEKSENRIIIEGKLYELKKQIKEEIGMVLKRFSEEKFYKSMKIGKTKGVFMTLFDVVGEKNPERKYVFDEWQKELTPHLYNLEQGIYVEDRCKSEPKCDYCGRDFIFLRKKKDEDAEGGEAKLLIACLEQNELVNDDVLYVFGKDADMNSPEVSRFKQLMFSRIGEPFRNRFEATKITDKSGNDMLENWEIYRDIKKVKDKFESVYQEI